MLDDHLTISNISEIIDNPMRSMENISKYGYPTSNLLNIRRCGAKTRKGTPCKGPAVRGKKRCRMHGGTNLGRPRDPQIQMLKYHRMVIMFIAKMCSDCTLMNDDCPKIHGGEDLPEEFESRVQKYCRAFPVGGRK